jgi:hypothetical protein
MKQLSIKKWSALGLVLMAASAVTAAVLPSKSNAKDDAKEFARGVLTPTSSGQDTCTGSGSACNRTAGSATSATGGATSATDTSGSNTTAD